MTVDGGPASFESAAIALIDRIDPTLRE